MKDKGLLKKPTLWLSIGVLAFLIIIELVHFRALGQIQTKTLAQMQARHEQYLVQQCTDIEQFVQRLVSDMERFQLPQGTDAESFHLSEKVARLNNKYPSRYLRGIILTNAEGKVIDNVPPAGLHPTSQLGLLLSEAGMPTPHSFESRLLNGPDHLYLQLIQPLRASDQTWGTLNLLVDLETLLSDHLPPALAAQSMVALLDQQGRILHSPDHDLHGRLLLDLVPGEHSARPALSAALARGTTDTVIINRLYLAPASWQGPENQTDNVLLSVAPLRLPGQGWSLLYGFPLAHPTLPVVSLNNLILSPLVATIGLLILLTLVWRNFKTNKLLNQQIKAYRQKQQEIEQSARIYQSRYDRILQNANDGLFFIDLEDGRLLDINHSAEQMLGYSHNELVKLELKNLFPKPYNVRFGRLVAKVRRTGKALEGELPFLCRDGSILIAAVEVRTGLLGDRKVAHGSFRDVTPKVNLAQELRRHNRRLSLLNEISHRVAEGRDLAGTLEIVLDQVVESLAVSGGGIYLLQQHRTEMKLAIHRNIPEDVLVDLQQLQPGDGLVGKVVASGRPKLSVNLQSDQRRLSRMVVEDNWHAFLAVPMIAEESTLGVLFIFDRGSKDLKREDVRLMQAIGRQVGPLVKNAELIDELLWQQRLNEASMREIERSRSALRLNLEQLEQTHRMLESLDQMKSTFLGLASHELRTPLTTILCGAELLQSLSGPKIDPDSKIAIDAILDGSHRLKQIVMDLLEAARLEARALYFAREEFNPAPMIQDLLQEHEQAFHARQLSCHVRTFPERVVIRGDSHHLNKALKRLLENAIKFTPEGGKIRIEGHILSQEEVNLDFERLRLFSDSFFQRPKVDYYLAIRIYDSGIGLAPSEHKKVFDKFYEVGEIASHSSSKIHFGGKGVGLGLTLVKGVVEALDGLVWVESEGEYKGSCFSILLPAIVPGETAYG